VGIFYYLLKVIECHSTFFLSESFSLPLALVKRYPSKVLAGEKITGALAWP
jgi:hypothetical protein